LKKIVHILLAAAFLFLSATHIAAGADKSKEKAKVHFDRAIKFFQKGEYADALIDFEASFKYRPHWMLKYNLAACHYYLKHDIEALDLLFEFLKEGGEEIKPKEKEQALEFMSELKKKVGTLSLIGVEKPIEISIDGMEPVTVKADREIYVKKGKHEVRITQGDETIVSKTVTFLPGETVEVIAKIVQVPTPAPYEVKETGTGPSDVMEEGAGGTKAKKIKKKKTGSGPGAMKKAAWVTLGLGAGLLAGGIVAGGFTLKEKALMDDAESDYRRDYYDGSVGTDVLLAHLDRADEHRDKARSALIATLVLLPAGGALAAASIALHVLSSKKGKESRQAAFPGLVVTPWSASLVLPF
jgi:hypothetical protein